jgi:hypothetical protein
MRPNQVKAPLVVSSVATAIQSTVGSLPLAFTATTTALKAPRLPMPYWPMPTGSMSACQSPLIGSMSRGARENTTENVTPGITIVHVTAPPLFRWGPCTAIFDMQPSLSQRDAMAVAVDRPFEAVIQTLRPGHGPRTLGDSLDRPSAVNYVDRGTK